MYLTLGLINLVKNIQTDVPYVRSDVLLKLLHTKYRTEKI